MVESEKVGLNSFKMFQFSGNKSICFAFWQSDQYEESKKRDVNKLILNMERVHRILGCSVAHPALKTAQFGNF